jgi:DoxX-like family
MKTPSPADHAARKSAVSGARWLRRGVAFVWLWTGLAVLHPHYRELGAADLARLGLPPEIMYATCVAEVLLGLRVALGPAATWVTLFQIVMIAGFTAILSVSQPSLWLDPQGMLTKNLPLVAMIGTAWLLEGEGWNYRAESLLRFGLALFWILNGILTLMGGDFWLFSSWQIGVGLLLFFSLRNISFSILGAVALILLGTIGNPLMWFHPFGPLTKVVAIGVASVVAGNRLVSLRGGLLSFLR